MCPSARHTADPCPCFEAWSREPQPVTLCMTSENSWKCNLCCTRTLECTQFGAKGVSPYSTGQFSERSCASRTPWKAAADTRYQPDTGLILPLAMIWTLDWCCLEFFNMCNGYIKPELEIVCSKFLCICLLLSLNHFSCLNNRGMEARTGREG